MSFLVRPVRHEDVPQLVSLARQFSLLNLPGDRQVLSQKTEKSLQSFAGKLTRTESEYLFVLEDIEQNLVVGSGLIMAKHGSEHTPHNYFKVLKKNHYSEDLGIGFIHQTLRFQMDTDGPTEIGGLIVDKLYRRRPEKLGKQMSLSRFMYIGLNQEKFEDRVLCELTPPLTEDGRSEFWESLGRRFTGLPYQEADLLSQTHKEFIRSLFPEEDIYLCLMDAKARSVMGRVGESTKPAQHLLESIGFHYIEEVDPFDGGPHYAAATKDILPIQNGQRLQLADFADSSFKLQGLLCSTREDFKCTLVAYDQRQDQIAISNKSRQTLDLDLGEDVFLSPFFYPKKGKEQT